MTNNEVTAIRPDALAGAQIEAKAEALLAKVGLSGKAEEYPYALSGGQCQRVAIARALMLDPDILCFDEPTSALDPELTGEVLRVIRSLKEEKRTMIIVTHEMEFARNVSDRVIFMADGKIEEEGAPAALFGAPKSAKLRAFLSPKE
jgi:polar amino acid transport system ATP-binding protein